MKRVFLIMLIPSLCHAQTVQDVKPVTVPEKVLIFPTIAPIVPQGISVVPFNPWGTGFSVVTTEKIKKDPFGEPERKTVTQIVPNDVLGMPQKTIDLW